MARSGDARAIVRDVLPRAMANRIWSASYHRALPVELNNFDLPALLPTVFYLFRFGYRRGSGHFLRAFAPAAATTAAERRRRTTADRIAEVLADRPDLEGFTGPAERAVLGDLLLCFCLQNARSALGRDRQIQRAAPTHYLASWIDLPHNTGAVRLVPEMVVATLSNQKGRYVERTGEKGGGRTWFPISDPERNVLLKEFDGGMSWARLKADRAGDHFDENSAVGLDQLLTARLAQQLESAPDKLRGRTASKIPNRRSIGSKSARCFSEDMRKFVRAYAGPMPRRVLLDGLESCVATGLTTMLGNAAEVLFQWFATGEIPEPSDQEPAQLLVDCSQGLDRGVQHRAEDSMDEFTRRLWRFPEILMTLRLLDYSVRGNRTIMAAGKTDYDEDPDPSAWIGLLGRVLHERQEGSDLVHYQLDQYGLQLADELDSEHPEVAETLRDQGRQPNAVRRLAAALTVLMGRPLTSGHLFSFLDSASGVAGPNALVFKRRTTRGAGGGRRTRDVRRLVFGDSMLEYLVHRHLLSHKARLRHLSFPEFLRGLRKRYGFHVDRAPDNTEVSSEILQRNRMFLQRRLRDLGLLRGVNDADSMKRLTPRFRPRAR